MKTQDLGTILSVWAHPDDETLCCGGIMAASVQNGQTVVCVTATKGEKGQRDWHDWPAEQLGDIRAKELSAALKILNIKKHHWLGYNDADCKNVPPKEAVAKIKRLIQQYQPDSILTFGPDGLTGHDDHKTVSKWVDQAVKGSDIKVYHSVQLRHTYENLLKADKRFNFFFNIKQPPLVDESDCDLVMCLPDKLLDKKCDCLGAMPSQYETMLKTFSHQEVCSMLCCEALVRAK